MSTAKINLPYSEFQFEMSRSRGPGGQHVNRTNSAVTLRWNIAESSYLQPEIKQRLLTKLQSKLTVLGEILIRSEGSRDQESNKKECLEKLNELVKNALIVPKKRIKTKPTRSSQRKRLETKTKRGEIKHARKKPPSTDF